MPNTPDKPSHAPKTITPEEAQKLIKGDGNLILDVTELDLETAKILATRKSRLILNGLTHIDVSVAEALAKHERFLSLNGLKHIDVPVAEALSKYKGFSLNLNHIAQIDVPIAEALAKYKGSLILDGLTQIDVPVAEALAKHEGVLCLNGLTQIDVPVAEALAKKKGTLWLCGLTHIALTVVKALAKQKGELFLNGLTQIDVPVAEALAKYKGILILNGLTQIDVPVAEALAKHKGGLYLNGLTHIDVPVAEALAKHKGGLYLNGLTHIDVPVAEALRKLKSSIEFGENLKISRKAYELLLVFPDIHNKEGLKIYEDKTQIASLKLPEEAGEQIKEWLPFFEKHPNFKDVVAGESGQICQHLRGKGVNNPEHFYNLNASRDIQTLLSDFLEFIGQLPNGFGLKTFYENFEREYLKKFENASEFNEIYKDEVIQAMANHLTGIIESAKQHLQKKSDVSLAERKAFFESKLNEPGLPDKIKNRYRKDLEKLLSSQTGDEASDTEKRMKDAENLLARFEDLHFIRPGKAGFKLASRNVKELTLGDECSDCTSATISGMNFWSVPTWLTDPGFNFLLQYDEAGKLAHKFGVVWEVKSNGEVILTIDSAELGNPQKAEAGMYKGRKDKKAERLLMAEALKFIHEWAESIGLNQNNIYATPISNTGTYEFSCFPKEQFLISKLGSLDAVERILKKYNPGHTKKPRIYLQSLSSMDDPQQHGEEDEFEEEKKDDFARIYNAVEKTLTGYIQLNLGNNNDYKKVKDMLKLASENPAEAARRMRIFLIMEAKEETKKALSVNGVRIDLYLANNKLTLEGYFNAILGQSEVRKGKFVNSELYHLIPNVELQKSDTENSDQYFEDDID